MMLSKNASLKDLQDAASLQAFHMRATLERGDLTPFQTAFFLNELAAACLDLSEQTIKEHNLTGMMSEVKPSKVSPRKVAPKPRRTRKPKTDAAKSNDA